MNSTGNDIECLGAPVFQLSAQKPKEPKPPTLREALLKAFPEENPSDFIAWAEQYYLLKSIYSEDGKDNGRLQAILDHWKSIKEQRQKWSGLPTPFPSLQASPITIADLHAYLSEILALDPLVATIPIYHEECCGATQTDEIEFDIDKGVLRLY